MQSEKFDELNSEAGSNMAERFNALKEHAEHFIAQQTEKMIEDGRAFELSDDEERMLKAYRSFISRSKPGSVFSWRCPEDESKIVTPADVSLIRDPQEVSS